MHAVEPQNSRSPTYIRTWWTIGLSMPMCGLLTTANMLPTQQQPSDRKDDTGPLHISSTGSTVRRLNPCLPLEGQGNKTCHRSEQNSGKAEKVVGLPEFVRVGLGALPP